MSIKQEIKIENIAKLNQLLKEIYGFIEALEQQVKEDVCCFNKQDVEVEDMTITESKTSK